MSALFVLCLSLLFSFVSPTILQNGQIRETDFPETRIDPKSHSFTSYAANASELSYRGRWDSKKVSWWSAPGLEFGFTGQMVAITFGPLTVDKTLVGFRLAGLDWQFTNATAGGTHLLVSPATAGVDAAGPVTPLTFEMRVTNWAYGVQIDAVHVAAGEKLVKLPEKGRSIEVIGDSLSSGQYASYEGLASWAYGVGAGLGGTEYAVTAYPGICAADQDCWGNPRGQVHQWFYTSDTSWRASQIWGDNPEPWDFSKQRPADIVVVNLGTNDANDHNNVTSKTFVDHYTKLVQGVHGKYPKAKIVLMSLWIGFYQSGNTFLPNSGWAPEIYNIYKSFNSDDYLSNPVVWDGVTAKTSTTGVKTEPFVYYFNTTGILQHNDIGPQWHPTDVGHIKIASHLIQWIKMTFGWELQATGPEVFHDTLYWNDQANY